MPVYLVHGFRWPRQPIRIHVVINKLDDVAPDWLMSRNSTQTLLANFDELYPDIMAALPDLRFIEQYSPTQREVTAPYAYVADTALEINLSADLEHERTKHSLGTDKWSAISGLRDVLVGKDTPLGWYVVVCDDIDRMDGAVEGEDGERQVSETKRLRRGSFSRGLMKVFGRKEVRKAVSLKDLKNPRAMSSSPSMFSTSVTTTSASPPPPIPPQYQNEVAKLQNDVARLQTDVAGLRHVG